MTATFMVDVQDEYAHHHATREVDVGGRSIIPTDKPSIRLVPHYFQKSIRDLCVSRLMQICMSRFSLCLSVKCSVSFLDYMRYLNKFRLHRDMAFARIRRFLNWNVGWFSQVDGECAVFLAAFPLMPVVACE